MSLPWFRIFDPVSGELHIFNVEIEDEGIYTCQAKNKAGFSSHAIELNVLSNDIFVSISLLMTWAKCRYLLV